MIENNHKRYEKQKIEDGCTPAIDIKSVFFFMFANFVVLVYKSTNMLCGKLERLLEVLKKNKLKMSKTTPEYLSFGFKHKVGKNGSYRNLRLGSLFINKVKRFKY